MEKKKQTKEQARILKVLSVETRLEILGFLKRGSMCVNALAFRLNISQGAVSQHLRVMRDAGLLIDDKQGYYVHYRIDTETLAYWKAVVNEVLTPEEEGESKDSRDCAGC
jgi:DNA-binding transcriptional ArsR family regulator